MSVVYTQQFQTIGRIEVSDSRALSVRNIRDTGDNLNNWVKHVGHYPVVNDGFIPAVATLDNTDNSVIGYIGYHHLPDAYSQVRWWLRSALTAGIGARSVAWTLYASHSLYQGDEEVDTTKLNPLYSDVISTTSATYGFQTSTLSLPTRDKEGYLYFFLAALNDSGSDDIATRAAFTNIAVQPIF